MRELIDGASQAPQEGPNRGRSSIRPLWRERLFVPVLAAVLVLLLPRVFEAVFGYYEYFDDGVSYTWEFRAPWQWIFGFLGGENAGEWGWFALSQAQGLGWVMGLFIAGALVRWRRRHVGWMLAAGLGWYAVLKLQEWCIEWPWSIAWLIWPGLTLAVVGAADLRLRRGRWGHAGWWLVGACLAAGALLFTARALWLLLSMSDSSEKSVRGSYELLWLAQIAVLAFVGWLVILEVQAALARPGAWARRLLGLAVVVTLGACALFYGTILDRLARASLSGDGPFSRYAALQVLEGRLTPADRELLWKEMASLRPAKGAPPQFPRRDWPTLAFDQLTRDCTAETAEWLSSMLRERPSKWVAGGAAEHLARFRCYESAPVLMRFAMSGDSQCIEALEQMGVPEVALALMVRDLLNGDMRGGRLLGRETCERLQELLGRDAGRSFWDWMALYHETVDQCPSPLPPAVRDQIRQTAEWQMRYWQAQLTFQTARLPTGLPEPVDVDPYLSSPEQYLKGLRRATAQREVLVRTSPYEEGGWRVDLSGLALAAEHWEFVGRMENVRSLFLSQTAIGHEDLKSLCMLTGLRELGLEDTRVTDSGLSHLEAMPSLEALWLARTRITDEGVRAAARLPSLRYLGLAECEISDEGLRALAGLRDLRLLTLAHTNVSDQGLRHVQSFHQLQFLDLSGTACTSAGLQSLQGLEELELLNLEGTAVDDSAVPLLRSLKGLKALHLGYTRVSAQGIAQLAAFSSLEELDLAGLDVGDEQLGPLARLPHLHSLGLSGTEISDAALATIASMPGLTRLYLSQTPISSAGLARLVQAQGLEELNLSQTKVGDDGVKMLCQLPGLRYLDLADTAVTSQGLLYLTGMPALQTVVLSHTDVSLEEVVWLQEQRPSLVVHYVESGEGE